MRKSIKIILISLISIILIIVCFIAFITFHFPNIPLENITVVSSKASIERGKYLANHVMVCVDCHSTRDWTKFSGPMVHGTEGKGGETFDEKLGFPGHFYSPNITPYHLAKYSDAQLYRAITSGVGVDGRPLFPIMPYTHYGAMSKEDIYSVITYIRSLQPIEYTSPKSKANFPMNVIMHIIPSKLVNQNMPDKKDSINYGKYLVNACGCYDCHTKFENGKYAVGMDFAGGREFKMFGGTLSTANITPDSTTGIGRWPKESFVARFKSFDIKTYTPSHIAANEFNTIMPWTMYGGMKSEDLSAIYSYLRTLKPINNKVVKFRL